MSEQQEYCLNCDRPLMDENFEFCPYCGQHTRDKLTLIELFRNTIANYFSFDSRIKRSFVPLIFKPGYLAKAFIYGKRQKYIHPAQFYLFCAVIFFFLFALATRDTGRNINFKNAKIDNNNNGLKFNVGGQPIDSIAIDNLDEKEKEALSDLTGVPPDSLKNIKADSLVFNSIRVGKKKLDSLIDAGLTMPQILDKVGAPEKGFARLAIRQGLLFYKNNGDGLIQNLLDKVPITLLLLLPIFAFILKLLYMRRKQPYVNHLVFTFYLFTFLILTGAVVLILEFINGGHFHPAFLVFFGISTILYLYVAMRNFYGQRRMKTIIKMGLLLFVYNALALPAAVGLIAIISFLTYNGA